MSKRDQQDRRIEAVIGSDPNEDHETALGKFFKHLKTKLKLPCEVTGIEDFRWEEPYLLGGWSKKEYENLKKTQPSFKNDFELLRVTRKNDSEWALCGDDIAAHVCRMSDGKKFVLGLSELEATDNRSKNYQLLDDYSVWFVNSR